MSAKVSIIHPRAHRMIPTMSRAVPNLGLVPPVAMSETAGELRIMSGSETVQTYGVKDRRQVESQHDWDVA